MSDVESFSGALTGEGMTLNQMLLAYDAFWSLAFEGAWVGVLGGRQYGGHQQSSQGAAVPLSKNGRIGYSSGHVLIGSYHLLV